jgi:hypothetical protein
VAPAVCFGRSTSVKNYLAGDNAPAGFRIRVNSAQTHAITANFLDRHFGTAVTIHHLSPMDAQLERIAHALPGQTGGTRAGAHVRARIRRSIRLYDCTNGAGKSHKASATASSESERSVESDENLHETFIGEELTRTFTTPVPLQLPSKDFRNSASPACATAPKESTAAGR